MALQWAQARLLIKWGGLGLFSARYEIGMQVIQMMDLSYLVSGHQSQIHMSRLFPNVNDFGSMERDIIIRYIFSFLNSHRP